MFTISAAKAKQSGDKLGMQDMQNDKHEIGLLVQATKKQHVS